MSATLVDGSAVTLDADRLVVRRADGWRLREYPLAHVADVKQAHGQPHVFMKLVTAEEVVFPAASAVDADQIIDWLYTAPRLQRRAASQRAQRKAKARQQMQAGLAACVGGVGIMAYTYVNAEPGGWFLVPIGAIVFGASGAARGMLQYFFD